MSDTFPLATLLTRTCNSQTKTENCLDEFEEDHKSEKHLTLSVFAPNDSIHYASYG